MEGLLGIPGGLTYKGKLAGLKDHNIALWDVIFSCERHGAMDHAIRNVTPNDIPLFLHTHPSVSMVVANGSTAGKYLGKFRSEWPPQVRMHTLPSTSPANARISFAEKLRAWEVVLLAVNSP